MSSLRKAIYDNFQLKNLENTLQQLSITHQKETEGTRKIEQKCKDIVERKLFHKIVYIEPSLIEIEDNCRTTIQTDTVSYFQLLSSIKKEGVLQNIVIEVRENPWRLVCIAGQRRLMAAKELNLEKIPCLIKEYSSKAESVIKSLDENQHRENLMPIEIAEAYCELEKGGFNVTDIAERYEKDEKTIKRYLKLGAFPKIARDLIRTNPQKFIVRVLFTEFAQKKWESDEEIILAVKNKLNEKQKNKASHSKEDKDFSKLIENKFGLKSAIKEENGTGKLTLYFKNEQEKNKIKSLFRVPGDF
jgi:ParB family chromosome partitioning protein